MNILRWGDEGLCMHESGDSGVIGDIDFDECIPFLSSPEYQDTSWLFTLGYFVSGLIFLPMSLKDLKVCN